MSYMSDIADKEFITVIIYINKYRRNADEWERMIILRYERGMTGNI